MSLPTLCAALGWSLRSLAEQLECNERTVRRWADGSQPTPDAVLVWLQTLVSFHQDHPAPDGWRLRQR